MTDRDRVGRRRHPEQGRGLRPIQPPLPPRWVSRASRVAMSTDDWRQFDQLVECLAGSTATQARAIGEAIATLLAATRQTDAHPAHWMDWERQKTLRLLRMAR